MKKSAQWLLFVICMALFLISGLLVFFNSDVLGKKPFLQTTSFDAPAMAKFEKDGNLYVIDSGSFRVICMNPDGAINYIIEIDKADKYIRIIDGAVDDAGNLYLYEMEAEYDALLTKREMIRKYDNHGNFIKDILSINYEHVPDYDNPKLFYQFGSFRCENGILSFSKTEKDKVTLYMYDTFRDAMQSTVIHDYLPGRAIENFMVAQLVLKDMRNYAYVLRDGDIYEVINGGDPVLRASFDWSIDKGGTIPWFVFYYTYNAANDLVFFDMASNAVLRITDNGLHHVVPQVYFDPLKEQGEPAALKGFGFHRNSFAGVYGDTVWLYDGFDFKTYNEELLLPARERFRIIISQIAALLAAAAFIAGLCILFIGILQGYISLFIKLTVVVIPLLIIAFIIVFTLTFNIMTEQLNEALYNEMISKTVISSKLVNGDDLDKINSIKDVHSDEYKRLSSLVKEIVGYNADPWNRAYYAALYKGNNFEYIVVISEEEWNLFRTDEPLTGDDYYKLINGEPIIITNELFNGTWTFANVPVYNSKGQISGKLEIGLDMTGYEISSKILKSYVSFIVAAVCVVILAVLCILISLIVRRLSAVGKVLHNIESGDRTARVPYLARDELGKVSKGLNNMAEELQFQFDRITKLNESTIRFVPIQFMEHLGVSDITKMKLGDSVQRVISVLFFDIRSFSINSEMMTARENFEFINRILGIAGPVIRKHNGFVDKYIGDAAMALFTNGIDAVRAGIELYQQIVVDKSSGVKIGVDGINIGVGIHSGSVMMGIVGENERLSSTVISANVNLASRLESLTKQTASGVLITRSTLNQLAGHEEEFSYRFIGMVQAAGVNEVVALFDMLDALMPKDKKRRLATKVVFESGVRKFHMKDYAAAVSRFQKVVAADPNDKCAAHYLEEAHKHLQNPELSSIFVFDKK
ncbi:MAG: HAMP domain-containing protein [Treponema sp.]|jgi:class 3 adenylate cyclase/methyl-accepting chemotaxis protein|nr:HAMP domain-containing protein [Treponema sp.]